MVQPSDIRYFKLVSGDIGVLRGIGRIKATKALPPNPHQAGHDAIYIRGSKITQQLGQRIRNSVNRGSTLYIPNSTEEAFDLGKKLTQKEILSYWEEYKRSLSDPRLSDSLAAREVLKRAFREQMLRETVEGYLGSTGHHSLTRDHIEMLLRKRRHYGTVSDHTDRKSL